MIYDDINNQQEQDYSIVIDNPDFLINRAVYFQTENMDDHVYGIIYKASKHGCSLEYRDELDDIKRINCRWDHIIEFLPKDESKPISEKTVVLKTVF